MSILSFKEIRFRIDESNKNAAINNRNLYPIQEQASIVEIWEYVPCCCDDSCSCKKYKRSYHWKPKDGLKFDDILIGYLRMFVDVRKHNTIIDIIHKDNIDYNKLPPRIVGAVESLVYLKNKWDLLYKKALNINKSLVCDDWCDEFWMHEFSFPISDSVYRAKQYSILLPDICIPYDNASRNKIKSFLGVTSSATYYEMLKRLRVKIKAIIEAEESDLTAFQRLDNPAKAIGFNCHKIALRREDINYGKVYLPLERPISRVIDKMFYKPTV